MKITENIRCTS